MSARIQRQRRRKPPGVSLSYLVNKVLHFVLKQAENYLYHGHRRGPRHGYSVAIYHHGRGFGDVLCAVRTPNRGEGEIPRNGSTMAVFLQALTIRQAGPAPGGSPLSPQAPAGRRRLYTGGPRGPCPRSPPSHSRDGRSRQINKPLSRPKRIMINDVALKPARAVATGRETILSI